jgi:hypothetical protein
MNAEVIQLVNKNNVYVRKSEYSGWRNVQCCRDCQLNLCANLIEWIEIGVK